jgi:hypothetical protein
MNFKRSLNKVIEYAWADELKHFECEYDIEVTSTDDKSLLELIKMCEKKRWTKHIFYHLMVLQLGEDKNEINPVEKGRRHR